MKSFPPSGTLGDLNTFEPIVRGLPKRAVIQVDRLARGLQRKAG